MHTGRVPRADDADGSSPTNNLNNSSITSALVLAAGNGDRFRTSSGESKLLQPLGGEPLILRTLRSAAAAGITTATVVLGYQADRLRALLSRVRIERLTLTFAFNPRWQLENGTSVLAARPWLRREPFALLMGDHVFEPRVLSRLRRRGLGRDALVLGVDRRPAPPEIANEATKVRLDGSRITAIGKHLQPFDALDTGMFLCGSALFEALSTASAAGDTTLTAGVAVLASRGLARASDVGAARWCDVDTIEDLRAAEAAIAADPEQR